MYNYNYVQTYKQLNIKFTIHSTILTNKLLILYVLTNLFTAVMIFIRTALCDNIIYIDQLETMFHN